MNISHLKKSLRLTRTEVNILWLKDMTKILRKLLGIKKILRKLLEIKKILKKLPNVSKKSVQFRTIATVNLHMGEYFSLEKKSLRLTRTEVNILWLKNMTTVSVNLHRVN